VIHRLSVYVLLKAQNIHPVQNCLFLDEIRYMFRLKYV